jgi:hypothetical protein
MLTTATGITAFSMTNGGASVSATAGRLTVNRSTPALPSVSFAANQFELPNAIAGLYSPTLNTVGISTSGTSQLEINPTGIVDIKNQLTIRGVPLATVATTGSYDDLSDQPLIPTTLGALSNVNTTGETTGQVLKFNGTVWVPAADIDSNTISSMTDATITAPVSEQALVWNGTKWVNQFVNYNSVTNKPTIPVNSSFTLTGLSDTASTPVANGFLRWNGTGTSVSYATSIPAAAITGLATVATTGNYSDLNNTPTIPTNTSFSFVGLNDTDNTVVNNGFLQWNVDGTSIGYVTTISSSAITGLATVATTGNYNDLSNTPTIPTNTSFSFVGLNDTDNTVVNNGFLRWNSAGTSISYSATVPVSAVTGLAPVATSGAFSSLTGTPTNSTYSFVGLNDTDNTVVNNGFLRWNATGTSVSYSATIPSTAVTGFATVATTGSYTDLSNRPTIPTNSSFTLLGLSDTATPAVANGYLKWNGSGTSVVYATTIAATDITGLATVATSGSFDDLNNKPTSSSYALLGLSDTASVVVNSGYLRWDVTGTQVIYSATIPAAAITGLATVATTGNYSDLNNTPTIPTNGAFSLLNLNDTASPAVANGYLLWNATGTQVIYSSAIPAASVTGLAPVATSGAYSSLTGTPTIPTNTSFSFVGLNDTDNTVVNSGYLRWNSGGTSISYSTTIPVASITGLAGVATAGTLASLTDVNVAGVANAQLLRYNGTTSKWEPATATTLGLVSTVFGRSGAVIATSGDYTSTLVTNGSTVVGTTTSDALNTLNTTKITKISGGTTGNFTTQASDGSVASSAFNNTSFATAAQGTLASTALQTGSNISRLNNDSGYLVNINSQSIDALNDVITTGANAPTNGQVLTWDNAAGQWKPGNQSAAVTISATYYADMFQAPNNTNWPVNAFASLTPDSTNPSLIVRAFDDTVAEGVGFMLNVPVDATFVTFKIFGRANSASTTTNAIFRLYARRIPNNSAIPSWSTSVTTMTVPNGNTTNFVERTFTYSLVGAGLVAGGIHNFELVRDAAVASDNMVGDYRLLSLEIGFS